jgi:hypothetical protein
MYEQLIKSPLEHLTGQFVQALLGASLERVILQDPFWGSNPALELLTWKKPEKRSLDHAMNTTNTTDCRAAGLFAATLLYSISSLAQSTSSFQGTVVGPSGNAIPGATITIQNRSTGLIRSTVSNSLGNYDAALLPPGSYDITAEAADFQKTQKTGIELRVNQAARVDFALQISTLQQSLTVQAEASLVDTRDSATREVVNENSIVDLPLNGRSFLDLGLTVPGVQDEAQNSNLATRGGGMNIAGGQDTQNNFLLDGFDNNDPTTGETLTFPTIDSIQELEIMGAHFGADVGFANGGVVSLVTRSGSSGFHGDAWEFVENDALSSRNFFATSKPPLKYNQFGGTLGGPLEKGKNPHLFFFGGYESTIDHAGVTQAGTVATSLERTGNFSQLSTPIVDPLSGQPFAGNIIPATLISPVGMAMLQQLFPAPTRSGLSQNFVSSPVAPNDLQVATGRVDFVQSSRDTFFSRFSQYWQTTLDTSPGPFAISWTHLVKHNYNLGGEWTHVFNPTTVQEFRLGFGHVNNQKWVQNQQNWDRIFGITNGTLATAQPNQISGGPPTINLTGYTGMTPFANDFIRTDRLWQAAYMLTHVAGNHSFRTGLEYRHYHNFIVNDNNPEGTFTFTGGYTGNAIADLLLGYPSQTSNLLGPTNNFEVSWQIAGYFQDNWRVSRGLSLNLGLRYEYQAPDTTPTNQLADFLPSLGEPVLVGTHGVPRGIRDSYYKDIAPRIGFAWDVTGKGTTSLRGGYGIFYESLIHNIIEPAAYESAPISQQGQFVASASTPNITMDNPFPAGLAATALVTAGFAANYHGGRTERWELNLQHSFGSHGVLEIAYVGSFTDGLASAYNLNQPPPGPGPVQPRRPFPDYTTITWTDGTGIAKYEALESKYEERLTKGLSLLAAYTFSKALDNTQDGVPNQNPADRDADYGLSNFDRRHRFVLSLIYKLPFHNIVLRNWQFATITTATTGMPVTPLLGIDNANVGTTNNQRPNVNGNPNSGAPHTPQEWFNTSVFSIPAPYTFGNAGRSVIEGPGLFAMNANVARVFRLTERLSLEVRAEVFNMTNHANFMLPNAIQPGSPTFGTISQAYAPREFQFGVKVRF